MREAGGLMLYPKEEGGRGREAVGDTGVCSATRTREAQMPSLFLPCIRGSSKGGIGRLVSSDQRRVQRSQETGSPCMPAAAHGPSY